MPQMPRGGGDHDVRDMESIHGQFGLWGRGESLASHHLHLPQGGHKDGAPSPLLGWKTKAVEEERFVRSLSFTDN